MTPWPSVRVSGSLIVRAMMSAAPPGAKPTTRRIGLVGYGCAEAAHAASRTIRATSALICDSFSGKPPLPAAVVLHVLEAPALARGDAEIELLDVLVRGELHGGAVHDHPAVLEDVAVIGVAQGDVGILLCQEKAHALLLIEAPHDLEDFLDDLRREPHRRLVEQDHARMRHQRAPECGHLLLSPRGVAGERAAPLLQLRKVAVHFLEVLLELRPSGAAGVSTGKKILLDGEMREAEIGRASCRERV